VEFAVHSSFFVSNFRRLGIRHVTSATHCFVSRLYCHWEKDGRAAEMPTRMQEGGGVGVESRRAKYY